MLARLKAGQRDDRCRRQAAAAAIKKRPFHENAWYILQYI